MHFPELFSLVFLISTSCVAQQIPAAISADPPIDKVHPASIASFQIPSHGAQLNAIAYLAAGAGPHPAVIMLHGFPGNEKNLDLAQAIRRTGWNAIFFDYRGSWGSPGFFSFANTKEDSVAAIAYLRVPANAAKLRIDPKRIALVGHSMGGLMAAYAGSHDPAIIGIGMISAANMGAIPDNLAKGGDPYEKLHALAANLEKEDILPLAGCSGESLARELLADRNAYDFLGWANLFGKRPLLLISSDDGLKPASDALAGMVRKQGSAAAVTEVHFPTDHSYSDHRIALETAVLNWLATLP
jgi:pimeloyl-ACP methyl ester carboxylesterase